MQGDGSMGNEKLTTSEAARRLGYGPEAVREMCESGQLDAYRRPRGHWRIDADSIDRLIESSKPKVRRR